MRQDMTTIRRGETMTSIDVRCIRALKDVRGMSAVAARLLDTLSVAVNTKAPITVRQRHELYTVCWRFRRQLPMKLQVHVTIALCEAKATAVEFRMNEPEPIRVFRSIDGGNAKPSVNPLDGLFGAATPATA